jgi:hypothetical protein
MAHPLTVNPSPLCLGGAGILAYRATGRKKLKVAPQRARDYHVPPPPTIRTNPHV